MSLKNKKSSFHFSSITALLLCFKCVVLFFSISVLLLSFGGFFKPKTIHIYLDKATLPSVLQMIDIVTQPANEPKFIAWNRLKNVKKTARLSSLSATALDWDKPYTPQLLTFINKNPQTQVVIHYNKLHDDLFREIIEQIPLSRIKMVHSYEDATGYFWYEEDSKTQIKKGIRYPVTYHFLNASYLKKKKCDNTPRCIELREIFKNKPVQEINLKKSIKNLSESQKKQIYNLANVDIRPLKKEFSQHPNILFVSGFNWKNNQFDFNQLFLLRQLCPSSQNIKNKKPYHLFYKSHPDQSAMAYLNASAKKICPQLIEIPAHIPFEILIIADLVPDKIAGYNSSLFFNVNPEDILFYIERNEKDYYLPFLKLFKKLPDEKIISLVNAAPPNWFRAENILLFFHQDWVDTMEEKSEKICRSSNLNDCAVILERTENKIRIKWDHWGEETFLKQENGFYQFQQEQIP